MIYDNVLPINYEKCHISFNAKIVKEIQIKITLQYYTINQYSVSSLFFSVVGVTFFKRQKKRAASKFQP